tara:strand:+ start:122 stop:316 length:195 start_codon:yes stop_codon:yes gene_type:complete
MLPDARYYAKKRYEESLKQKEDAEFRDRLSKKTNGNRTYEDNIAFSRSMYQDMYGILQDMRDKR